MDPLTLEFWKKSNDINQIDEYINVITHITYKYIEKETVERKRFRELTKKDYKYFKKVKKENLDNINKLLEIKNKLS